MGISDTDSSFAANFSIPELKGVEHIIRDGKATLSNIREIFIYYGATSFMKATSSFILMYDWSYFSPNQITFYNYSSNLILTLFLVFSGPTDQLTSLIPNDNFMGWENALIYIGNFLFPTVGLILCEYYTLSNPFFQPNTISGPEWILSGYTNTVILLCLEIMITGVIFGIYVAHPFKKPICFNIPITILLVIDVVVYIALFFLTKTHFVGLIELDIHFVGPLFGIALATIAITITYSYLVRLAFRHIQESDLDRGANVSVANYYISN
jgi:magnesium-transporting ATPase (P-type)